MKLTREETKKLLAAFKKVVPRGLKRFSASCGISREWINQMALGNACMEFAMQKKMSDEILEKAPEREQELQGKIAELSIQLQQVREAKKLASKYENTEIEPKAV